VVGVAADEKGEKRRAKEYWQALVFLDFQMPVERSAIFKNIDK